MPMAAAPLISILIFLSAFTSAVELDSLAIFNFGDSNSDTGTRVAAGLETIELPYGQSYFKEPAGRFCDGRLIIDFLNEMCSSPQNIAAFGKDPSKLDELGCVSSHSRAAKLFNLQLHSLCTKLQVGFGDANITYIDIFSIKSDLIANYSRYGFENPIAACCGYGGPPLNYDSRIGCGQTKILNGSSITANGCTDATEYINWDGIHYTEASNLHVSTQILTGKYSDPPFADKMPFLLKLKF